ncbi:hypothetical protein LJK88_03220 [Paenibacillus sp. P26]|nr:hypothetical protein LJK88_03220 [Paenibacillus sp. P26]
MKKLRLVQQIVDEGVVAVLRGETPDEVVEMAEQAIEGGIKVIEVTMTVPLRCRRLRSWLRNIRAKRRILRNMPLSA